MNKFTFVLGLLAMLRTTHGFATPFISSFTPTFGSASDPGFITINGSGFSNLNLIVKFNGVVDPTAGVPGAAGTSIQAHVPADAPLGSGPIFVSVNGESTSSGQDFTVIGPGPYVQGFAPDRGNGGTSVTITGAHFTASSVVRFNGQVAPPPSVPDSARLTVNAPNGVTSGNISVSNNLGSHTSSQIFYVPASVSGFSPPTGRTGTNVIISGSNFLGATSVLFSNQPAVDFTVLSNSAIRASVPVNAVTGPIRVVTPTGSYYSTSNFVIEPTISGFAPGFGPTNTSVTVFGANLNAGTPVVRFNGVQAAAPTGVTFNQLTAVVPVGASTGPVTVTTSNGVATSTAKFYLPDNIDSNTPSFGPAGTPVTITGTNFTEASAVTFNGTPAAAFSVQDSNRIGAIVPFGISSGPISITTPAGSVTNPAVKYYGVPFIGSFSPTHGLPGTNVVLTGQNFLDATAVLFAGTNAAFSVVNNSTINAVVPPNAITGPVTVRAPGGTNTTPENFVLDYTANLLVTVSDAPDPVSFGSNVIYSIVVSNAGPFAAPGVTLTDQLVGPALLVGAATTHGTLNTNGFPITGALGQLGVGNFALVTLTVSAQALGMITNIATVASLYQDPFPANNSAVNTTYVQPVPLLSVRRVGADRVRVTWPGELTNYGIEFKPLVATNVWSNTLTSPILVGSEYQLTETNNQPSRYYRLRRLP